MRTSVVSFCFVLACSLLSGCCFGGAVFYNKTTSLEHFSLGQRGEVRPELQGKNPTRAKVQELWGQPDAERNEKDGVAVWRYRGAWSWAGVVPMYFVPVPLCVPTGHDYIDIYIQDTAALKARQSITCVWGAGIGPDGKGFQKFNARNAT